MSDIYAFFDGAFIWGENHAGYGALVKRDREVIFSDYKYVGNGSKMSVNVAEYSGLIAVLKFLIENNINGAMVRGDSKLVIKQITGKWKIRSLDAPYVPYLREARELFLKIPLTQFKWIPREYNGEADELAKSSLRAFYGQSRRDDLDLMFEQALERSD